MSRFRRKIVNSSGKTTGVGLGFVFCPPNYDIEEYRILCIKRREISLITNNMNILHRAKISDHLLSQVIFPTGKISSEGVNWGSPCLYILGDMNDHSFVVSAFEMTDEGGESSPGNWKITCKTNTHNVSLIQGNSDRGSVDIVAESTTESATVQIRAVSENQDSLVRIDSDCDMILFGKNSVVVKSEGTVDIDGENVIRLGTENLEHAVLGDTLNKLLSNLSQTLIEAKVLTSNGPAPFMPDAIQRFTQFKTELDKILSGKNLLE